MNPIKAVIAASLVLISTGAAAIDMPWDNNHRDRYYGDNRFDNNFDFFDDIWGDMFGDMSGDFDFEIRIRANTEGWGRGRGSGRGENYWRGDQRYRGAHRYYGGNRGPYGPYRYPVYQRPPPAAPYGMSPRPPMRTAPTPAPMTRAPAVRKPTARTPAAPQRPAQKSPWAAPDENLQQPSWATQPPPPSQAPPGR